MYRTTFDNNTADSVVPDFIKRPRRFKKFDSAGFTPPRFRSVIGGYNNVGAAY